MSGVQCAAGTQKALYWEKADPTVTATAGSAVFSETLTWPPGSARTASGQKAGRRGNPQPGVRRLEERHVRVRLRRKDLTVRLIVVRP